MYNTSGAYSVCNAAPTDNDIAVRTAWLKGEIIRAEDRAAIARAERDWELAASMLNPVYTKEAYARFGLWLGLLPPAAIFYRILSVNGFNGDAISFWGALFFVMNVVCCVTGWKFAGYLGRKVGDPRSCAWSEHVGNSFARAMLWALVTGGLGGVVGFFVGAVVGAFFAAPVALATFPVFAVLHRIQSHGGMIEERDLWPIAFGIPLAAAALIMSLGQYNY